MTTLALDTPVVPVKQAFTLSDGQQAALEAVYNFLTDPAETVFVLEGYAGCGKSTLVATLIDRLPNFMKTARLLNPSMPDYELVLTATTNKAAEALSRITDHPVSTIYSHLGLRVQNDFRNNTTSIVPSTREKKVQQLLLIDEGSYINSELLQHIFDLTSQCKIVILGDRAQLVDFKTQVAPVFVAGFPGAALTEVMRQAKGNPIIDLATAFRHTVNGGPWPQFKPDGFHIAHLGRAEFNQLLLDECSREDWRYTDSKYLAWTNKVVIQYNQFIRDRVRGSPHFSVGDYAVCNSFTTVGKKSIKTDQLVEITRISSGRHRHGVSGTFFEVDHTLEAFMPDHLGDKALRLSQARKEEQWHIVSEIEQSWIDLRAAYAQTVNKSQGSTYDSVFIDLDDIRRCNSGNQIARMLYVAVSRARNHVYLTGDLV